MNISKGRSYVLFNVNNNNYYKLINFDLAHIYYDRQKGLDISGIEPEAFRMQSERDTTTPYTQCRILIFVKTIF